VRLLIADDVGIGKTIEGSLPQDASPARRRGRAGAAREPVVDAEVVIAVEDPLFPENTGPWWLRVTGGKASVERTDAEASRPIPIGVLSSMFADDPAVPALARSFDGPDPWCPFFF
jgi:sterol carrier protein